MKITRSTPLHALIRQRIALTARLESISAMLGETEDELRLRVMRMLWGYGRPSRVSLEDAEEGLRETFPELREALSFATYRETAEWLLENKGGRK